MTSPKTRGYVFAIMQFSMGGIIILLSFIERNIFNRTQISIVRYISYILIFLCIVTMLTAFIQYGQYITPNPVPRDSTVLRTNGIYSVIRHPMYMGALVGLVGLPLALNAYYSCLLNIILIAFFVIKIKFEEKQLIEKFPEYENYQKRTKKLVPYIY